MDKTRGYYSIVQYIPSRARDERLNIAVILTTADKDVGRLVGCRVLENLQRIYLYPSDYPKDYIINTVKILKSELGRVEEPKFTFVTPNELFENIHVELGENFLVPQPRYVEIENFEKTMDKLFDYFVDKPGFKPRRKSVALSRRAIVQKVKKLLRDARIEKMFETRKIEDIEFPFVTQNGRLHLLEPLSLYPTPSYQRVFVEDARLLPVTSLCYYAGRIYKNQENENPAIHALLTIPEDPDPVVDRVKSLLEENAVNVLDFDEFKINPKKYLERRSIITDKTLFLN